MFNTFFAKLSQEPTESETTTPEAEQSGGIPIVIIVAAVSGGIVRIFVIVVVCVLCDVYDKTCTHKCKLL